MPPTIPARGGPSGARKGTVYPIGVGKGKGKSIGKSMGAKRHRYDEEDLQIASRVLY